MEIDEEAANRKLDLANEATLKGRIFFNRDNLINDFNRGCDHVSSLLHNAFQLYSSNSFSTSIFISITAIEEIAKLEIAIFRREGFTKSAKNRKEDYLFSHKAKHSIALQEIIVIGKRLPAAIGEERVRELLNMAETGGLIEMREASLYMDVIDGKFTIPRDRFTKREARDILLLALEVWDDGLVGLTSHTGQLDRELMELFDNVKNS